MNHRYLAAIGLLVAACNREFPPPPSQGGGGGTSGAAGIGGGAGIDGTGSGRPGNDGMCPGGSVADVCIDSCSSGPGSRIYPESAYCDPRAMVVCADGKVKLSSCAPDSCARTVTTCCDETTGLVSYPSCSADGRKQPCPAGSHSLDTTDECVPPSLGVTDCAVLNGAACGGPDAPDRCSSHAATTVTVCVCAPLGISPTVTTWVCKTQSTLL